MKISALIIFICVVLILFILVNYYIYTRASQALSMYKLSKTILVGLVIIFSLSFVLGMFLQRTNAFHLTEIISSIGSYWLVCMLFIFILLLTIDISHWCFQLFNFSPPWLFANPNKTKLILFISVVFIVTLILVVGSFNTAKTKIEYLDINISAKSKAIPDTKVLFISDIHFGSLIGKKYADRIQKITNETQPDLILLGGDIIDYNLETVKHKNLLHIFKNLNPPLGIYSCLGNHEYFNGQVNEIISYLEDCHVTILKDEVVRIENRFNIIGRDDRETNNPMGRQPLNLLKAKTDKDLPTILLDHQPYHLDETVDNKIDLQLSGHTHHSQLWPLSLISNAIFDKDWGYLKKQNSHFYVSCGFGTWGPPVRIGSYSEAVVINLTFH